MTKKFLPPEYRQIQSDLEAVLTYIKGYQNIDIDCTEVMNKWYDNKQHIIELFGDKLIYEFPKVIEIELTSKEKEKLVDKCIRDFENQFNNNDLIAFIDRNKNGLLNNLVVDDNFSIKRLKKGDKLLKSFKYFSYDEDELRKAQDLASQYIQKTKVKGILCLSVHPLDFMTISENNSNWRSCHSMDGEYCVGNMNYMLDTSTFVVYLKSEKDEQLICFPENMLWNNKKWRVLAHLNDLGNCIWFSKQYPFNCMRLIKELHYNENSPFHNKFQAPEAVGIESFKRTDGSEVIAAGTHLVYFYDYESVCNIQDIVIQNEKAVNYNDLTRGFNGCSAIIMRKKWFYLNDYVDGMRTDDPKLLFRVNVGETFKPICGHDLPFYDEELDFVCHECGQIAAGNVTKCECCGRTIYPLEPLKIYKEFKPENLWVCNECFKELNKFDEV